MGRNGIENVINVLTKENGNGIESGDLVGLAEYWNVQCL